MHCRHRLISFFLTLSCGACAAESAGIPEAPPLERYAEMIARSPFALASEAPPPADTAGFAKDLVLTGVVRMSGCEYITVASRDQTLRFSLRTGEAYNGIVLVNVAWSDMAGKTRATLRRGGEYGVISFDEAASRGTQAPAQSASPAAAASPARQPLRPRGIQPPPGV